MVNFLKSLNTNYDPSSRTRLSENLLESEIAKVNTRVYRIIEKNENLTLDKFLFVKLKFFILIISNDNYF